MLYRVILLSFGVFCALTAPAASDDRRPVTERRAVPSEWQHQRMALGHKPRARPVPDTEIAPQRSSVARQCQRWRSLAVQLSETYAGHRLRHTVLQRMCGVSADELAEEIWAWPWTSLDDATDLLPPAVHRVSGVWEIRCDEVADRRRCALLHRMPPPADPSLEGAGGAMIVHFVVDMVAGRESVLWRVFVPGMTAGPRKPEFASVALKASELTGARGHVRYRLGAKDFSEGFPACGVSGCMMEAQIQRAGVVASRLWEGKPVEIELQIGAGPPHALVIPARGFKAAFGELLRLRREEARNAARR